jgi:hypothetical protein
MDFKRDHPRNPDLIPRTSKCWCSAGSCSLMTSSMLSVYGERRIVREGVRIGRERIRNGGNEAKKQRSDERERRKEEHNERIKKVRLEGKKGGSKEVRGT